MSSLIIVVNKVTDTSLNESAVHVQSPIPGKMPRLLFTRVTVLLFVLNIFPISALFSTEFSKTTPLSDIIRNPRIPPPLTIRDGLMIQQV